MNDVCVFFFARKLIYGFTATAAFLAAALIPSSAAYGEDTLFRKGMLEFNIMNVSRFSWIRGDSTNPTSSRPVNAYYFDFQTTAPGIEAGYFAFDDLSFGGGVTYNMSKKRDVGGEQAQFIINPYVRYYIPITDRFAMHYTGRFGPEWQKYLGESHGAMQMWAGMGVAMDYFFFRNLGSYFSFDYKVRFSSLIGKSYRSGYEQYALSIGVILLMELQP